MLLPRATGAGQVSRLYVAVSGEAAQVVGAVALGLDRRRDIGAGWRVDLRVIVPFRRRGIGRALIEHAVDQAHQHGIRALDAWAWVEPDSDEARAWISFGFMSCQRRLEFEADLRQAHDTLMPLYTKIRDDGWIPRDARIIPLAEADLEAVADLHVRYLGGNRRLLMPLLRGDGAEPFDLHYSRVLLLDGHVVGFTLGRILHNGVCEIDANVLHPGVRLGWANLWLKKEAAAMLLSGGIHTIRYFSLQQHTDTQRVSRQVGGRLVGTTLQMRRELSTARLGHGGEGVAPA